MNILNYHKTFFDNIIYKNKLKCYLGEVLLLFCSVLIVNSWLFSGIITVFNRF